MLRKIVIIFILIFSISSCLLAQVDSIITLMCKGQSYCINPNEKTRKLLEVKWSLIGVINDSCRLEKEDCLESKIIFCQISISKDSLRVYSFSGKLNEAFAIKSSNDGLEFKISINYTWMGRQRLKFRTKYLTKDFLGLEMLVQNENEQEWSEEIKPVLFLFQRKF